MTAGATLPALTPWARAQEIKIGPIASAAYKLTHEDIAFLDDLQRRGCMFFLEQASPDTGQVLDRAKAFDAPGVRYSRRMASIAATGFGLTALCIVMTAPSIAPSAKITVMIPPRPRMMRAWSSEILS